jgi:hypothetical protein
MGILASDGWELLGMVGKYSGKGWGPRMELIAANIAMLGRKCNRKGCRTENRGLKTRQKLESEKTPFYAQKPSTKSVVQEFHPFIWLDNT